MDAKQFAKRLYVVRMDVELSKLLTDYLLEIAILVFNGTPEPIYFQETRGNVRWFPGVPPNETDLRPFPPRPTLRDDQAEPVAFAPFRDGLLIFNQRVAGADAQTIHDAVNDLALWVDFQQFKVLGYVNDGPDDIEIPLWGASRVSKPKDFTLSGRVIFGRMSATLRGGPTRSGKPSPPNRSRRRSLGRSRSMAPISAVT